MKRKERELISLSSVHRLQHSSSISHLEFSGAMATPTPTPSPSTANRGAGASGSGGSSREGTAKAAVADQISQAVQSTSNLLHLMQQSSPSQAHLIRLPKSLLAKTATIKNTAQVLEHMPWVISSLDAYMENSLQSLPHLNTVIQLLSNIESSRLNSASLVPQPRKEQDQTGEEHEP